MDAWRLFCIAALLSFLLPGPGCLDQDGGKPPDPLAVCGLTCQQTLFNSVPAYANGTCTCSCGEGARAFNGTCVSEARYYYLSLAACKSGCAGRYPHSSGEFDNDTCSCVCEKGFVSYNGTCITPQDFTGLAPQLCARDYPVLKIYDWSYRGKGYYFYLCYRNETGPAALENRSSRHDYWNFVDDPYSNATVSQVEGLLENISAQEGFGEYERVDFSIDFVQSLPYTFDNVSTPYDEYPRYPAETIFADGGDCEDTSILMAAILERMGQDVVLLHLPGHVAVGVRCDPEDFNRSVSAYPHDGAEYCYVETTGEGYGIGQLPDAYAGVTNVTVIPLRGLQPDLYIGSGRGNPFGYSYWYDANDMFVNVTDIRVDNFGTAAARGVKVYAALVKNEAGGVWDGYTLNAGDIPSRGYFNGTITGLHAPTGEPFRIRVVVSGDNFNSTEAATNWFTWHQ